MYNGAPIPDRVLYGMRQPRSPVLVAECTKSWAWQQIQAGAYPKGAIWYPGCCEGAGARPDIGDLFGPDPNWKPARPIDAVPDDRLPSRTRE